MSREKAIEYLRLTEFQDNVYALLVKSYSALIKEVPPAVWAEVFMDLDYGPTEDIVIEYLTETFDEEELDVIIDFAKQPVFKKFIAMQSETDIDRLGAAWHQANHKAISERIKRIFPARGIPQDVTDTLVSTFLEEI